MRTALLCLLVVICGCDEKKAKPMAAPSKGQVLYAFQATWCGPCHAMEPTIKALEADGFKVKRIDVDKEPKLAAKYRVQSLPTFVAIRKGVEVGRVVGVTTKPELKRLFKPKKNLEQFRLQSDRVPPNERHINHDLQYMRIHEPKPDWRYIRM